MARLSSRFSRCRLRWHLHELDLELEIPSRGLRRYCALDQLAARLATFDGTVARLPRVLVARCRELGDDLRARELTTQINALEPELRDLVRAQAPSLVAIPGLGVLGAAAILGETAGAARFKSKHAFVRFNGTAPAPVWSGNNVRVRLNRSGNRTVNTALHMAAVTQSRGLGPRKSYVDKLGGEGKTRAQALRLLRRRLSGRVFNPYSPTNEAPANLGTSTTHASGKLSNPLPVAA